MRKYWGLGLVLLSIALYLCLPREWGLMDDLNFVVKMNRFRAQGGIFDAIGSMMANSAWADRSWGLFRPAYWVYPALIYLDGPVPAYLARFFMFATIIAVPLMIVSRALPKSAERTAYLVAAGALLVSNRALYDGLSFVSLQELSGLFFVTLGLSSYFLWKRQGPRLWWVPIFLVLAAWFKSPFLWVLMAFGLWLAFFEKRSLNRQLVGIVAVVLAVGTLFKVMYWVEGGGYTGRAAAQFQWGEMFRSIIGFTKQMAAPGLILIGLAILWGKRWLKSPGGADRDLFVFSLLLFLGGGLYLGSLLPWGATTGYYYGPSVYLFSTAVLLWGAWKMQSAGAMDERPSAARSPLVACMMALALLIGGHGFWKMSSRDRTVRGLRDWALALPPEKQVIAMNGVEAPERFEELMEIRTGGAWTGVAGYAQEMKRKTERSPLYYVEFVEQGEGLAELKGKMILKLPMATVYETHL